MVIKEVQGKHISKFNKNETYSNCQLFNYVYDNKFLNATINTSNKLEGHRFTDTQNKHTYIDRYMNTRVVQTLIDVTIDIYIHI